jgi:hypothetical protein
MVARRSRPAAPAQPAQVGNALNARISLEYKEIDELHNYEFNPRDNTPAIESVANSIRQFGFLIPVVVGEGNVIAAGHTRVAAARLLGMEEVPTIKATHLTTEQLDAFRLIDNKVAELARWDFDMLSGEIAKIQGAGLTLTDFGWTREELDCLSSVVADDCLNVDSLLSDQERDRVRGMVRRAPATARFVLGEVVFFISASDYRRWVDGLRVRHDYNETEIIASLKASLGIVEEQVQATIRVQRNRRAT